MQNLRCYGDQLYVHCAIFLENSAKMKQGDIVSL